MNTIKSLFFALLVGILLLQCSKTDSPRLPAQCNELFTYNDGTTIGILPTAFSPNGDGINDVYRFAGTLPNTANFKLSVYRLTGELMFETTDYKKSWDGNNSNGTILPDELYKVEIQLTNAQNEVVTACTHVYLLKGASNCVHLASADPSQIFFEDQFDLSNGTHPYATFEKLCP